MHIKKGRMIENNFGVHLTIDIENCDREKLTNNKFIYRLLNDLPNKLNMKAITLPYIMEYKDEWAETPGITGFVVIATSHISIHTFPEQKYTFLDIFSCTHFNAKPIADEIIKSLGSNKAVTRVVERGKNFNINNPPYILH